MNINIALIDGQNLHLGTRENNWSIDQKRFRVYLSEKYKISEPKSIKTSKGFLLPIDDAERYCLKKINIV